MAFSWSPKNCLFLAASVKNKESTVAAAHIIALNSGFETECYRRLANEFYNIFQKRKSLVNEYNCSLDDKTIGFTDLQKLSAQYQIVIQAVCNNLNDDEQDSQSEILKNARLIWSLIDALLLRSSDTLPSGDLAEWSSTNFKLEKPTNDIWDNIFVDLCTANVESCLKNLEQIANSRKDPFFLRFLDHMRNMPSIYDNDKLEWAKWQQMTLQFCNESYLAVDQQVSTSIQLISGREEAFRFIAEKFRLNFYQILPGFVLFSNKFCKIYELFDFAQAARKFAPSIDKSPLVDDIFSTIFELDVINILKLCSTYFNNWLFVAHLVDLLKYGGCADLQSLVKDRLDLSEYMIFEYANSLMSHESLWQLAVEYFLACPTYGTRALRLHIQRLADCNSDHKILKLLALCQKCDFDDLAQIIIRQKCVENLKAKKHSMALSWCLQSEDPSLATLVAEQILDSCQNLNNDDLISCLNSLISVKSSIYSSNATLLFLSKYKDFCDYQRSGKLREAVDLLTQLLIRKAAPRRFWLNLLEDLLLLLQGGYKDNLFQNSDILYNLITFVETLNIEIETTKSLSRFAAKDDEKRSNIQYYRDLMHDVRLYLNKCMLYCNIS